MDYTTLKANAMLLFVCFKKEIAGGFVYLEIEVKNDTRDFYKKLFLATSIPFLQICSKLSGTFAQLAKTFLSHQLSDVFMRTVTKVKRPHTKKSHFRPLSAKFTK